jgi:hypothetical protein
MARNQTFTQPHSLKAAQPPFSDTNAAEQGRCTCWVSASGLFYASPMRDERRGGGVSRDPPHGWLRRRETCQKGRLVSIGVFRLALVKCRNLLGCSTFSMPSYGGRVPTRDGAVSF